MRGKNILTRQAFVDKNLRQSSQRNVKRLKANNVVEKIFTPEILRETRQRLEPSTRTRPFSSRKDALRPERNWNAAASVETKGRCWRALWIHTRIRANALEAGTDLPSSVTKLACLSQPELVRSHAPWRYSLLLALWMGYELLRGLSTTLTPSAYSRALSWQRRMTSNSRLRLDAVPDSGSAVELPLCELHGAREYCDAPAASPQLQFIPESSTVCLVSMSGF
ncbi:hypothetical protein R1flu_027489 [Riccia fluitans]|uniref:Uncharacterized protein n=1 Tax=Riccia fluitans TaxID=41844 RepID=A0ABD1XJ19_9MARC